MNVKTYRADSMHEALQKVRTELGPDAAVLETRRLGRGLFGWLTGGRRIEVTASAGVNVPSRFSQAPRSPAPSETVEPPAEPPVESLSTEHFRMRAPDRLRLDQLDAGFELDAPDGLRTPADDVGDPPFESLVERLAENGSRRGGELGRELFELFTELIDAELEEDLARELIEKVRTGGSHEDSVLMKARVARLIEEEIAVAPPLEIRPGRCRLAALVGPTGVGKTTTIAKLAANFRLRERRRVGLITVDTYRIAAVDQLRTYADIIDLPMEVVSTPREMRAARERMSDLDLVLLDTAGRSPRDEVKLQELKSILTEARADDIFLVLSSVASGTSLAKTAERFAAVGTTSLVLTKLDEAAGLGNILPLLRSCRLPLSYVTDGQNVPDDIEAAESRHLAQMILKIDLD